MIFCIGEVLVDEFFDGTIKSCLPGGAPFNVACNVNAIGKNSAFYGALGCDENAKIIKDYAKKEGLNAYFDELKNKQTTVARVTLTGGERSFAFIRDNGADYTLSVENLKKAYYSATYGCNGKVIAHFGSLMLSEKEGRAFFKKAIDFLKGEGAIISFDVNYREDIFDDKEESIKVMKTAVSLSDIVKFGDDELKLISGKPDVKSGLSVVIGENQTAVVTFGKDGSMYYRNGKRVFVSSKAVKPVDTTGAGDAFYSYFLYARDKNADFKSEEEIVKVLKTANAYGALATLKKGALGAIATKEEVEDFLSE